MYDPNVRWLVVVAALATCATGCASGESHERSDAGTRRHVDAGADAGVGVGVDAGVGVGVDAGVGVGVDAGIGGEIDAGGVGRDAGGVGRDAGGAPASDGGACAAGLTRCGAVCVDTRIDVANCGGCGVACSLASATAVCTASACAIGTCTAGHANCNGNAADGCEGSCAAGAACTTACGSTGTTSCAAICAPACAPPGETCDVRDENCDGSCDEGVAGCRAGVHRSYHSVTGEHFYTTSLTEAGCCGFTVEFPSYFYVYAAVHAGLAALHRCVLSSGMHFYTTAAGCEGSPGAVDEGVMGYVAGDGTCGATQLYRLWHPTSGHFYTTSAAERDYAAASLGFTYEGVAGWVWPTP